MTWKDLIRLTLQDLRVVPFKGVPSADDESLAMDRLNLFIDWLKTQDLAMFQAGRTVWNLTGASSYAVGVGATINCDRPMSQEQIAGFSYINNNLAIPAEIGLGPPLTDSQYESIAFKSFQSPYPSGFYYSQTLPTGTVIPWPIPTTGNLQGVMYSDAFPVQEIAAADLTTPIVQAPGYRVMLLKGLKVELRDAFRVPVSEPELQRWEREAAQALGDCKRTNEELDDLSFGEAGEIFSGGAMGPRNIYTGD